MRIIKGRDYYDGAGLGVDTEILFVRDAFEIPAKNVPLKVPLAVDRERLGASGDILTFFALFIAGEMIPGAIHLVRGGSSKGRNTSDPDVSTIHYDWETVEAILKDRRFGQRRIWWNDDSLRPRTFFELRGTGPWTAWSIDNKIVTGTLVGARPYAKDREVPAFIANGDNLKDFEAYRAVDPATAHMAISNWIGGVLPTGPETVEISNSSKIRKAGFDLKTSFRKEPEASRR